MLNILRPYLNHIPQIGQRVMLDSSCIVIGRANLGDDVSIWPNAVIRADVNQISIGARTNIQDGCVLHANHSAEEGGDGTPLIIGEDVTIGHRAILHGCQIGNRVLIGIGAIILDNVVIEDDVLIGVGSLVPSGKCLISGYLYLGSPARRVRKLTEEEITKLKNSATGYVTLKNNYLAVVK